MRNIRTRKGFSLIELLVAVVIIGIVGSFVYSKILPVKENAYKAAMTNSLAKMVQAQENYMVANDVYGAEADLNGIGYYPDDDVTFDALAPTTNAAYGFHAIVSHAKTAQLCGIEYGASGPAGTEWSGKIYCDEDGDPPGTDETDVVDGT